MKLLSFVFFTFLGIWKCSKAYSDGLDSMEIWKQCKKDLGIPVIPFNASKEDHSENVNLMHQKCFVKCELEKGGLVMSEDKSAVPDISKFMTKFPESWKEPATTEMKKCWKNKISQGNSTRRQKYTKSLNTTADCIPYFDARSYTLNSINEATLSCMKSASKSS